IILRRSSPLSSTLYTYTTLFQSHVFEQYVTAGTRLGLEKSQVEESIRNLIIGTSKMIERSELSMEQLRKNIILLVPIIKFRIDRSEEHTSELQSRFDLVFRLLL